MRAAGVLLVLLAGTARAAEPAVTSLYTSLAPRHCTLAEQDQESDYQRFECPGTHGISARVEEFDSRAAVSFPPLLCPDQPVTFTNFAEAGTVVEWRLAAGKPFAAIVRYTVQDADAQTNRTWLVVTWIGPDRSCPAALVSGATLDANAVARQRADALLARPFRCGADAPTLVYQGQPPTGLIAGVAVCP